MFAIQNKKKPKNIFFLLILERLAGIDRLNKNSDIDREFHKARVKFNILASVETEFG